MNKVKNKITIKRKLSSLKQSIQLINIQQGGQI